MVKTVELFDKKGRLIAEQSGGEQIAFDGPLKIAYYRIVHHESFKIPKGGKFTVL